MHNAKLPRRLAAILYDSLLVLAVLFIGTIPFIAMRDGEPVDPGNLLYQLSMVFITYVFFVGFWFRYGRTLGMQSWGLRIETADGSRPTLAQCSTRFFTAVLSLLPMGLGFWWQWLDTDGLSWHDHLSGTRLRYYPKS